MTQARLVLNSFLFLDKFQPRCSYQIVLIKKSVYREGKTLSESYIRGWACGLRCTIMRLRGCADYNGGFKTIMLILIKGDILKNYTNWVILQKLPIKVGHFAENVTIRVDIFFRRHTPGQFPTQYSRDLPLLDASHGDTLAPSEDKFECKNEPCSDETSHCKAGLCNSTVSAIDVVAVRHCLLSTLLHCFLCRGSG